MPRPAFFAQRYVRLMTKTAAAVELGPAACWMLAVIVAQEDAKRYVEPAKWYYQQLMPLCGFTSRKQLSRAINRAVEFGWLEYKPGRKGKPCYFSATIPARYSELDQGACDESTVSDLIDSVPESELQPELNTASKDKSSSRSGTAKETKGNRKGRTSIPSPNPSPKNAAKSSPLSYPDEFERWWSTYPANASGRKRGKATSYTVWKSIPSDERLALMEATRQYAAETTEFIRDPERFLKRDWWRDWIAPPEKQPTQSRVPTQDDLDNWQPMGMES